MTVDNHASVAAAWLTRWSALEDPEALFTQEAYVRDHLCFLGWDYRTVRGIPAIRAAFSDSGRLARANITDAVLETAGDGAPARFELPTVGAGVQAAFRFSIAHPSARARGFVRLVQDANGAWKAATLYAAMLDLIGHEEPVGRAPPTHDGVTWADKRAAELAALDADLTVLIVGAGHSGLMAAARFKQLGLRTLVIERNARVGDNWRNRYPTLALHTPAHMTSFPYLSWPSVCPEYIPAVKVADFMESYVANLDLNVWTSTEIMNQPTRDKASGRWTVQVTRDGKEVVLRPKHIVLAMGINVEQRVFSAPGMESFRGTIYPSAAHRGAAPFAGQRVLVIGACNSAVDIAQDFSAHASEVTILQRSVTCVQSLAACEALIFKPNFPNERPISECDFLVNATPLRLVIHMLSAALTGVAKNVDKQMHDGLRNAGFRVGFGEQHGEGEIGLFGLLLHRGGGYYVDVGCSELIARGKVKVKQGTEVDHFEPDGVVFKDGSRLSVDVVVTATGYLNIKEMARRMFGDELIASATEVWDLDDVGELRGVWRPSGVPGLYYGAGDFPTSRYLSKMLGLQILAQELGLVE